VVADLEVVAQAEEALAEAGVAAAGVVSSFILPIIIFLKHVHSNLKIPCGVRNAQSSGCHSIHIQGIK
jgi:hypothetical protein